MEFGPGLGISQGSAQAAFARRIDIFVDAALGSDSNDGSAGSPLRTFQEAVYRADDSYNPGFNNIFLAPGNYNGAYINDDDLLKVFGQGANPWDVTIGGFSTAGFESGSVIRIGGGTDVRLYNMQVSGGYSEPSAAGSNGIYASGLDYLFLDRVISSNNYGSGLYAEYVTKVKLYNSVFEHNDDYGAYIYDSDKVRSVASDFSYNYNDGIRVDYVNRMELIASTATYNGYYDGDAQQALPSGADGAGGSEVYSVLINGGVYNHNDRNGVDLDDVYEFSLVGIGASGNYNNGVDANGFYSGVIDGGLFEYNGNNGAEIEGGKGASDLSAFGNDESDGNTLTVYGGQYLDNYDVGIDIKSVYNVQLFGVDARHNEDGIGTEDIGHLLVGGGYLYSNYENGIEMENVYHAQVNDLTSVENGENGLYLYGGRRLNILGGNYSNNYDWGIYAEGYVGNASFDGNGGGRLQRVDIKYATANHNNDGVYVSYAYLGKIVGGSFSHNNYDGIAFDNVAYGIFQHVTAIYNGNYGLRFDAGRFCHEGPGEPALSEEDLAYLGGSNWNRVDMLGGLYAHNGDDGIYLSTNRNRGYNRNALEVNADYVVSRDNGYTGLNIGGFEYDGPVVQAEYGYGTDLYLDMLGGYYGYNGDDGIYLLGTTQEGPRIGMLVANMTDVVAEHNQNHGVRGSGVVGFFPDQWPEATGDGQNGQSSLIQVTRGSYSFNGQNGLKFELATFGDIRPRIAGDGQNDEFYSLADFDHVVAIQNGANGLTMDVYVGGIDGAPDAFAGEESNGDAELPPLIQFTGGVYNQNGKNGIRLASTSVIIEEEEFSADEPSLVAARLEDVEASLNGLNGLLIRNDGGDNIGGDVEIIRGVYNANGRDGIFIRGLGYIYVNQAVIASNHEDGLHSRDNWGTFVSDDSVIVGNQSQNVRID